MTKNKKDKVQELSEQVEKRIKEKASLDDNKPTFSESQKKDVVKIDLFSKIYGLTSGGVVIEKSEDLFAFLYRCLRDDREKDGTITKQDEANKAKRQEILFVLIDLKHKKRPLILEKSDDPTRLLLMKRCNKIYDVQISAQINAILKGETNPYKEIFESQDQFLDFRLLSEKLLDTTDIEVLKEVIIDLLEVTSISERANLPSVNQFFATIVRTKK